MHDRIWTASNLLSFFRVILVLPIALLILADEPVQRYYAFGLILAATLTDLLDGMLARKLNQVTELGKIIDPLADKIAVVVVAIILAKQGKLPVWYVSMAFVRDVLIFLGGLYVKKNRGIILQSNRTGKWAVTAAALLIALAVLDNPALDTTVLALTMISAVLFIASFVLYAKRFIKVISSPSHT